MLMMSRRIGERIVVGDGIEIQVCKIGRRNVRLAVNAPAGYLVLRGEVWDAIASQNREAATATLDEDTIAALAREPADSDTEADAEADAETEEEGPDDPASCSAEVRPKRLPAAKVRPEPSPLPVLRHRELPR